MYSRVVLVLASITAIIDLIIGQQVSKTNIHGGVGITKCLLAVDGAIISGADNNIVAWSEENPIVMKTSLPVTITPKIFRFSDVAGQFLVATSDQFFVGTYNFTTNQLTLNTSDPIGSMPGILDMVNMVFTNMILVINSTTLLLVDVPLMQVKGEFNVTSSPYTVGAFLDFSSYYTAGKVDGSLELRSYPLPTFVPQVFTPQTGVAVSALTTAWRYELILVGYANGKIFGMDTKIGNAQLHTYTNPLTNSVTSITWMNMTAYFMATSGTTVYIYPVNAGPAIINSAANYALPSSVVNIAVQPPNKKNILYGFTHTTPNQGGFAFRPATGMSCFPTCDINANSTEQCHDYSEYGCYGCVTGFELENSGFCNRECVPGKYLFRNNNTCVDCHAECKTCTGASTLQCLECNNNKLLALNRSCQEHCPDNQYMLNTTHCAACFPTCLTCSGFQKNECLTCQPGRVLDTNGECVVQCGAGRYKANTTHCALCDPGCATCSGPGPTACLSCYNPEYTYVTEAGICIDCSSPIYVNYTASNCNMTREMTMIQKSTWNYDMFSSISVEIVMPNRSFFRPTFYSMNWNNILTVTYI